MDEYTRTGFPVESTVIKSDSIKFIRQFSNAEDPNVVVANCCLYFLPQDLTATQMAYLKTNVFLTGQVTDSYWTNAWYAYISNTGDAMAEGIVRGRLDALINYITSMEEYQLF